MLESTESAVNGNEVQIHFSQAVDPATVFTSCSTLVGGLIGFTQLNQADGTILSHAVSVTDGSLSEDGKTLTVLLQG